MTMALQRVAMLFGVIACALLADAGRAAPLRIEEVRFAPGQTRATIKGAVRGPASVSHRFGAEAGQSLTLTLSATNRAASFNLYAPGRGAGDEALAIGGLTGHRFTGRLESSGVYTVNVFLIRAAARRNERASYRLTIALTPKVDFSAPVAGDFADGLQGGPDHWVVAGLRAGSLRLRQSPSAAGRTLATFPNGAVLRNSGCRMIEGGRWCKVAATRGPAVEGWVDGRYLRESATSRDALAPGTPFHATGEIPCAQTFGQPTRPCRFGVVREGGGTAAVTVFFQGGQRVIRFVAGAPANADSGGALAFTRNADLFLISVGEERYEIPEAAVNGG